MPTQLELENLSFPLSAKDVFHFDEKSRNFDALATTTGKITWSARDVMDALGYQTWESFNKVVQRATNTCISLGINIQENFEQSKTNIDGKEVADYNLSRFACYLLAMNGDTKKVEVARAQVYFAALAETFRRYVEEAEEIERVLIRDEITDREKGLSAAASQAGVKTYGFALFQNAGYRGMYNMNMAELKLKKGIPSSRSPLDFMGKTELAANLFRITQTEDKLRNEKIKGQNAAEVAAESVGRKVRQVMHDISGARPENLPKAEDIKTVKGALKASAKDFERIGSSKANKKKK